MHASWHLPFATRIVCAPARAGDLRHAAQRAAWCAAQGLPSPAVCRQVHGTAIHPTPVTGQPDGDGLVSDGAAIGVFGADCPSVVLAAPDALGAAHAGWRGTAAGIILRLVEAVSRRSRHPPEAWHAWIGPAVHPDDYEVDEPVLTARRWPTGCLRRGRPSRAWLDLPAAIADDLHAAGVAAVARCGATTSRDPRLHSHRRDGRGAPQLILAWRDACAP